MSLDAPVIRILLGSLALSLIHAAIPNHWIPLVAIGRAEGWARSEALRTTALAASAHVTSTLLIGLLAGLLGRGLSAQHAPLTSAVASSLLIGLGVLYLVLDRRGTPRDGHRRLAAQADRRIPRHSLIASLCLAMFFSPCLEIEAYFFTAGTLGWRGIVTVSLVYLVVTIAGMMALVDLGLRGARRIRSDLLDRHEKAVVGLVLVALGGLTGFL